MSQQNPLYTKSEQPIESQAEKQSVDNSDQHQASPLMFDSKRGERKSMGQFLKAHHEVGVLIATWLGLGAAIWIAIHQNTVARELVSEQNTATRVMARQQTFMALYQQWESEEMQEHRARLANSLLNKSGIADDAPLVFLETLANATRLDLVDKDLAWTTFYIDLVSYWAAVKYYTGEIRKEENCSCIFEELEKLSAEFRKTATVRDQTSSFIGTEASVTRFLEWERSRSLRPELKEGVPKNNP